MPDGCNVGWYLESALGAVGNYDHMVSTPVSDDTITSETLAGRPLGAMISWSGGGAHFIMLIGGGPNNMVQVRDPINGDSYIPYDTLLNNYQGSGTWIHVEAGTAGRRGRQF